MSRKPSGSPEAVERALSAAETTQSATELRRALAVTLPVLHGLTLKETALLVGRSETWVAKERQNFIQKPQGQTRESPRGGRRNQLIPAEDEDSFMEMVCEQYIRIHAGWSISSTRSKIPYQKMKMSFVEFTQAELEQRIQRRTTRTTVYNLLARTGKRVFPAYEPYMWGSMGQRQAYKRYTRFVNTPLRHRTPELIDSIINGV